MNHALDTLLAGPGTRAQGEIYLAGRHRDARPKVPTDGNALEAAAREVMDERAFAYVAGGAGREATAAANRAAFARHRIVPRMLRDVGRRDLSVTLLGKTRPHPLLAAPIGVQELMHPDADLATARACAAADVPMIVSNQASHATEAIASAAPEGVRWFQLYWGKSDELAASLVRRAETAGCEALVVTLDTPLLGWRTRDLDLAYLPFLEAKGIAQYTCDPVFRAMLGHAADDPAAASLLFMTVYSNPAITWERLAFLRETTRMPILLKGIQHADDARRAVDAGMDGVIVSNHGGRQVDGAIGALDALPAVAGAVAKRIAVLFDSGVRGGADIVKALALGADAVCIGRPYAYGLALAGEAGVAEVFRNFLAELDLTLGLAGVARLAELAPGSLAAAS